MAIKKSTKSSLKTSVKKASNRTSNVVASIKETPKNTNRKKNYIIGAVIVAAILIFIFKSLFVVAIVNGSPITRLALIQLLEEQAGKKALDSLVTKTLILQEAQNKHISVSPQEISDEMKKIEDNFKSQGQSFDEILKAQGITRSSLIEQIKLQKIVTKLAGNITVTDKEVDDYIEKNKDSLSQATDQAKLKDQVKAQLIDQKTQEKIQSLVQNLQGKAKILYFLKF